MKDKEPTLLQSEIKRLHGELGLHDPESDEYDKIMKSLNQLYTLQQSEKEPKKRISPDTLLLAATNIAGIVIVLAYEHAHPIVSKAFSLVSKVRI